MELNRLVYGGNLTRDPEMRVLAEGRAVVKFTVANSRKYKDQAGETHEETTFLDCEAWGKTADIIGRFLQKGKPIIVEGRIIQQNWEDKTTGQKRSKLGLRVDVFHFLPTNTRRDDAPAPQSSGPQTSGPAGTYVGPNDEPPF